jgi:4-hydroxy-2-oxoheptanedioate aldolase
VQMPVNAFKQALRNGAPQIGLWLGLADPSAAELMAMAGFDWLVIDAEHSPNDLRSVLAQLQAIAPYPVHPIVRLVNGAVEMIKQYLDIGVQTLIVPMIETAAQAALVVAATRYPTRGVRGVASATTRASRWGRIEGYFERSDAEMCVVVQVESVQGLDNLRAIAAVEGVDGVFFGPADLAASMGMIGKGTDPRVRAAIAAGIAAVNEAGKAAGTLSGDVRLAREYLSQGARFVAVGIDTALLLKAAADLAREFKLAGEGRGG